jgi:hypothetical protein
LSANGQCAEALGVKGTVLLYSGRRQEGRDAIQQHLRLSPRDPARPIRLSQIAASFYIDENFETATTTAKQVIRQHPKHPTAYRWSAASLGQLGRVEEGEAVLQHLQTAWPSSFDMYVRATAAVLQHRACALGAGPAESRLEGVKSAPRGARPSVIGKPLARANERPASSIAPAWLRGPLRKRLVGLERDTDAISFAPGHPAQVRGRYEHELIGNDVSLRDSEHRTAVRDIHDGALAVDRITNRDLRGNVYSLSRVPAPFRVDVSKVRPR